MSPEREAEIRRSLELVGVAYFADGSELLAEIDRLRAENAALKTSEHDSSCPLISEGPGSSCDCKETIEEYRRENVELKKEYAELEKAYSEAATRYADSLSEMVKQQGLLGLWAQRDKLMEENARLRDAAEDIDEYLDTYTDRPTKGLHDALKAALAKEDK